MKTSHLVVLTAAGVGVVWIASRGFLRTIADLGLGQSAINSGLLTDDQIKQLTTFKPYLSTSKGVISGAAAGAPLAVETFGISVGIGALIGWIAASRNQSLDDRKAFAARLGFTPAMCRSCGPDTKPGAATLGALYETLDSIGRHDLVQFANTIIGKSDYADNQKWMYGVLDALQSAGFRFAATP